MILRYNERYQNYLSLAGFIVVILFCIFYCFDYFLQVSISVFLMQIKHEFMLNNFQLGLMGAIFFVSYVAFQMPGGYLIDRFGVKYVTLALLLFCTLGALLMWVTKSYWVLLFARFLLGLGLSIAFLCAIRAIMEWVPTIYFSLFIGILQALVGMGSILGQNPMAYLNESYNWHQISAMFAGIAIILFSLFVLVGSSHQRKGTTLTGKILMAKKISMLAAFKKVMVDKTLLKLAVLSFIAWSPVASLAGFWLIPMFKESKGINIMDASDLIAFFWVGLVAGAILAPIISTWLRKRRPILIVGFYLQAFALIAVLVTNSLIILSVSLFILGVVSPIQGFIIVIAKDLYTKEDFGLISGMLNMFGTVSGGVMQLVVGGILTFFSMRFSMNSYLLALVPYILLAFLGIYLSKYRLDESYRQ